MDRRVRDQQQQDFLKNQIDSLKIFNDNVKEIIGSKEYSVGFQTAGQPFNLHVYLTSFPNETPKLVVKPSNIVHSWINANSGDVNNAPGLVNFSVHSDLGGVVRAIIRELEQAELTLVSAPSPSSEALNYGITDLLEHLSVDDLNKLNTDELYLNDFVEECDNVQTLADELDNLIVEVEALAVDNMGRKQHIDRLQLELADNYSTFHGIGTKYDALSRQYQQKADEFTPSHIKELLQIGVSTADAACEMHVEEFLDRKIDVQTFLDRYMSTRKLTSLRKAKEERLAQQLTALERATF